MRTNGCYLLYGECPLGLLKIQKVHALYYLMSNVCETLFSDPFIFNSISDAGSGFLIFGGGSNAAALGDEGEGAHCHLSSDSHSCVH